MILAKELAGIAFEIARVSGGPAKNINLTIGLPSREAWALCGGISSSFSLFDAGSKVTIGPGQKFMLAGINVTIIDESAEPIGTVDPAATAPQLFARWLEEGPKLAKAAGLYVGIKVMPASNAEKGAK